MSGTHFIVYAARHGAKSFFEGISDPTFFSTINRILDDGYYKEYEDPRHREIFCFQSLRDFVVHPEGLDIPDWVPFMKALRAQDDGSAAKDLYWRMVGIDSRLDPFTAQACAAQPLTQRGEIGKGRVPENRMAIGQSKPAERLSSNSQERILRRLARDRPDVLERVKTGEIKSARAAAIEAGIITPFPSLQLKDPSPTAQKLLAKKGKEWCLELLEELSSLVLDLPA
jgi:hypothetical protein